jgi:ribosomal protein S18 acetylase RimI-like enzyme
MISIRILKENDAHLLQNVADDVFDHAVHEARIKEFLEDPHHHLIVALDGDTVVGFISAVHYLHPDKAQPELWINEVGVAATHRERGIGKAMMQKTLELGKTLGCTEAWVLTQRDNTAAMKLYGSSGGVEATPDHVMFTFHLNRSSE